MNKNIKVGVIGCGYQGINLVRNFYELGALGAVSDLNKEAEKKLRNISKNIKFKQNYLELLKDNSLEAIVIATPANTHFKLVEESLNNNKHVFVEKPLCLNFKDGTKLKKLSAKKKLKLMVGHLMLYPAFSKMKKVIADGIIEKIMLDNFEKWKHNQLKISN